MTKYKEWNEILCEELHKEMERFEHEPVPSNLKNVKDLTETIKNLQEIEAAGAMRRFAEEKYGYDDETGRFHMKHHMNMYDDDYSYNAARRRDSRGRYTSNRGGRGNRGDMRGGDIYDDYDGERFNPNEMYTLRQENGRPIMTPYAKHDGFPKKLTNQEISEWAKGMENSDGTNGAKWTKQEIESIAKKLGVEYDDFTLEDLYVTANMMYSDYCDTLAEYGANKPEVYICLAKDFLDDEDASVEGSEKLAAYYHAIVKE